MIEPELATYIIQHGVYEEATVNPVGDATAKELNDLREYLKDVRHHRGAVKILKELLKETQLEEWMNPFTQTAVLAGMKRCIKRLEQGGDE